MNKKTIAAMGAQEGDFMRLTNQWANVYITRLTRSVPSEKKDVIKFLVDGDADTNEFNLASEALSYALEQLAEYEKGACR